MPDEGPDQPMTCLLLYLAVLQQEGLCLSFKGHAPGFYSAELTRITTEKIVTQLHVLSCVNASESFEEKKRRLATEADEDRPPKTTAVNGLVYERRSPEQKKKGCRTCFLQRSYCKCNFKKGLGCPFL